MKDCKKIHPLLSGYLDGLLSALERGRVESHLKDCAEARKELEGLRRLREILVALPEPKMPQDLHQRIMAGVKGHPLPAAPRRPFWVVPAGSLAAAAMVAVVILVQNPDLMRFQKAGLSQAPVIQQAATPGAAASFVLGEAKSQGNQAVRNYNYAPNESENKDVNLYSSQTYKTKPNLQEQFASAPPTAKKMRAAEKAASADLALGKPAPEEANVPAASLGPSSQTLALGASFGGSETQKSGTGIAADGAVAGTPLPNTTAFAAAPPAPAVAPALALPTPTPVTSWGGSINPSTPELQELVTDNASFQKYWQDFEPGQALPAVDFTAQAVVVLMDQERPTAGYSIHVASLEDKPDQLVIHYKVEAPAPGTVSAQVLTRPWALQIISKPAKPVVFQKD